MASLEQRSGIYRVVFRFGGEKFSRSLRTKSENAEVEEWLGLNTENQG